MKFMLGHHLPRVENPDHSLIDLTNVDQSVFPDMDSLTTPELCDDNGLVELFVQNHASSS